jgi:hypothetical protein
MPRGGEIINNHFADDFLLVIQGTLNMIEGTMECLTTFVKLGCGSKRAQIRF